MYQRENETRTSVGAVIDVDGGAAHPGLQVVH